MILPVFEPDAVTLIDPIWLMTSSPLDSGETVKDLLRGWAAAVEGEAEANNKPRTIAETCLSEDKEPFNNIPFTTALPFEAFDIFQQLTFLVVESEHHLLLNPIIGVILERLPGISQ